MELVQSYWYTWGTFIAFVVALVAAFWIFFDTARKSVEAIAWKMVTVLAVVLILPSPFLAAVPDWRAALAAALLPLALLGIAATAMAVLSLLFYLFGVGVVSALRCANCGRPRDPTWPYCPYCQYDRAPIASGSDTPLYPPRIYDPPTPPFQMAAQEPSAPQAASLAGKTVQADAASGEVSGSGSKPDETRISQVPPVNLAYIAIHSGPRAGKTYHLGDVTNIGRNADLNDVVLDDDSVSRQHARIRCENGKFILVDLDSSNHTCIQDKNGEWKQIQKRTLADGMLIKTGDTILKFMLVKTE